MTDMQSAASSANIELVAAADSRDEASPESRMPLLVIVYVILASVAQVLWLGLIGWSLLNLF
jgi:hypothetical protein